MDKFPSENKYKTLFALFVKVFFKYMQKHM